VDVKKIKLYGKSAYVLLFVLSFVLFLFLTFPYGVLKESISNMVAKTTGIDMRIGEMSPSLPLGFDFSKVSLGSVGGGPTVEFEEAEVGVSLLNLFIGALAVDVSVVDVKEGTLDATVKFSLYDMIFKKSFLPYRIDLETDRLGTGQLIAFGLDKALNVPSNPTSQMVVGLLDQLKIDGKLTGHVALNLDKKDFSQSSGSIDLVVKNAELKIDPALDMSNQTFSKAVFKGSMVGGDFNISKDSGFHTQELMIDFSGNVKLRPQLQQSVLNVMISLKLDKGLKEKFGFIIDAKGGTGGMLKISIKGTMANPYVVAS
jgi:type II secretion system protein N